MAGTSSGARTRSELRLNKQGFARGFFAGLQRPRLTPLDELEFQSFTEVSGLNLERTDDTTITLPSDTDGARLDEVITGRGALQNQTFTLTEYMDVRNNSPYLKSVKRNLPGSILVAEGRNRRLADRYDFDSAVLVDKFFIQGDTKDDSANPSEGDPGNPNKITANCTYHGRNRHVIRQVSLTEEAPTTHSVDIQGAVYIENQVEGGGTGREWFVVANADATGNIKPAFIQRDNLGNWQERVEFGADTDLVFGLQHTAGYLITLDRKAPAADAGGHWWASLDTLDSPKRVLWGFGANAILNTGLVPTVVWAKSPTEIWYGTGESAGITGRAKLLCAGSPLEAPKVVKALTSDSRILSIHGYADQVVAVGGTGTIANDTPIIWLSNDRGNNFSEVTGPSGARGLTTVFMTAPETFIVGDKVGDVYFTYNNGKTWHESITDPDTAGTDSIVTIKFFWPDGATEASRVGYMVATDSATDYRLYRTLNGGKTWIRRDNLVSEDTIGNFDHPFEVAGPQSLMIPGTDGKVKIVELE